MSGTTRSTTRRRSEGSVIKRGSRYTVLLSVPGTDGKRKRTWHSGFATKREAEQALRQLLAAADRGSYVDPSRLTVASFAERFIDHMTTLERDARTVEGYAELLRNHVLPYLGGVRLQRLTPLHLSDLYALLRREGHARLMQRRHEELRQAGKPIRKDSLPPGLSPRMVGHVHRAMHRMLKQAVRWELVSRNVASYLAEDLPSVPTRQMVTLTGEQAGALLRAAENRPLMRSLVLLGVATGARLGELLALRWDHVDLEAGTLKIGWSRRVVNKRMEVKAPKTESGARTLVLGPATVAALKRLRAEQAGRRLALGGSYHGEDLVICKPDGQPYRPDSVSGMFRMFVDKAGLPKAVHVHTLRHSAASFQAAAGVPASDIAAQLGHKDGGALALKVYVHPMAEGLARAGAVLDQVVDAGGGGGGSTAT